MFAWSVSAPEIIALLVLAVLLFGKKLPEVAASMGKSVRVFQNSWNGIEEETVASISQATAPVRQAAVPQRIGTAVPKFDELAAAPSRRLSCSCRRSVGPRRGFTAGHRGSGPSCLAVPSTRRDHARTAYGLLSGAAVAFAPVRRGPGVE